MAQMKTPGVSIAEKNAFPNSVVEVATAVPAFIGHTEVADNKGKPLPGKPWRITSMAEYHAYFGVGPMPLFDLARKTGGSGYLLTQPDGRAGGRYLLYRSMLHFFQNGGGPCYIVSVGDYATDVNADALRQGIESLATEQEPTMVLVPDAMLLEPSDAMSVQRAMLDHCGGRMRSCMAILDIPEGWKRDEDSQCIARFRSAFSNQHLDFGAAYYPWLNTSVVQAKDLGVQNIAPACRKLLIDLLRHDVGVDTPPATATPSEQSRWRSLRDAIDDIENDFTAPDASGSPPSAASIVASKTQLDNTLSTVSELFRTLRAEMAARLNLLPPGAAMAGIWTLVDNTRGVWKAPANVSLSGVVSPAVTLSDEEQSDLNSPLQGPSINTFRAVAGEGVLVWGAHTLDGNSADWRYISVRRTVIMLEESCRLAAKALVFEPNVANTWVTVKSMIHNFLTSVWKRGGLAGTAPEEAFSVHVGLGETMTPQDIVDGVLRVTVLVAVVRPGEFIAITFAQQMQKS